MRLKYATLVWSVIVLTSCAPGSGSFGAAPPLTPLHTPVATPMPTPLRTPSPVYTATPEVYPPIDASVLPPALHQFLARYGSFEEMNANIQKDYIFIATEINRRPAGTLDSSPLSALTRGISDCYETAAISALLGEKLGYKPYMLILEHPVFSTRQPHSIHVFQDTASGLWGYNDYLLELHEPEFVTLKELADFYIKNHLVEVGHYDFWYLVDLTRVYEAYGLDWRTTTRHLRIREKIIVEHGVYIP